MNEVIEVVTKKYAQFSGRARRREYWMFTLISQLSVVGLTIVDRVLGLEIGEGIETAGILSGTLSLILIIPYIALTARRLHDTGRSGWWMLISFIPLIGWLAFIVFLVSDSAQGSNKWGPNPKSLTGAAATPAQTSVQNW
ncbi:DUF805 domain-containing protein [Deinococcus sp. ME38]|uniref:DUF805 domain-containing protein n=1 Tax=Deinococcus sp. ME38 TaxID=3400344 RepID=UPI003B5BD86B